VYHPLIIKFSSLFITIGNIKYFLKNAWIFYSTTKSVVNTDMKKRMARIQAQPLIKFPALISRAEYGSSKFRLVSYEITQERKLFQQSLAVSKVLVSGTPYSFLPAGGFQSFRRWYSKRSTAFCLIEAGAGCSKASALVSETEYGSKVCKKQLKV
jgi:hypothetical protein